MLCPVSASERPPSSPTLPSLQSCERSSGLCLPPWTTALASLTVSSPPTWVPHSQSMEPNGFFSFFLVTAYLDVDESLLQTCIFSLHLPFLPSLCPSSPVPSVTYTGAHSDIMSGDFSLSLPKREREKSRCSRDSSVLPTSEYRMLVVGRCR